jgi:hypothetical protein
MLETTHGFVKFIYQFRIARTGSLSINDGPFRLTNLTGLTVIWERIFKRPMGE